MKLLIIEDNPRLSMRMRDRLQRWYVVEIVSTGEEGILRAASGTFDVILLDLGLPDAPGLEVCKAIRTITTHIPILVVTGVDTSASRISLLNSGADDYITKPFDITELRARINALGRRIQRGDGAPTITVGDLVLDPGTRSVSRSGIPILLRKKEYDVLEYMASNPNRVLSRQMIVDHAWPITNSSWTSTVDVHIKQLRDKIDRPFSYNLIKTLYGVGYMLTNVDDPATPKLTKMRHP